MLLLIIFFFGILLFVFLIKLIVLNCKFQGQARTNGYSMWMDISRPNFASRLANRQYSSQSFVFDCFRPIGFDVADYRGEVVVSRQSLRQGLPNQTYCSAFDIFDIAKQATNCSFSTFIVCGDVQCKFLFQSVWRKIMATLHHWWTNWRLQSEACSWEIGKSVCCDYRQSFVFLLDGISSVM